MSINVHNLSLGIDGVQILKGLSFNIEENVLTCITGPNGSGKSSLLKVMAGDIQGWEGQVNYPHGYKKYAYLPQNIGAPPFLTVCELIILGFYGQNISNQIKQEKMFSLVELCGISNLTDRLFSSLSAGEQQRVWVAFALAQNKPGIFMDEPFSSIDIDAREHFFRLLNEITGSGTTLVVVTHDIDMARKYSNKMIALESGHLVLGSE